MHVDYALHVKYKGFNTLQNRLHQMVSVVVQEICCPLVNTTMMHKLEPLFTMPVQWIAGSDSNPARKRRNDDLVHPAI